jgi:hypothetical protein
MCPTKVLVYGHIGRWKIAMVLSVRLDIPEKPDPA